MNSPSSPVEPIDSRSRFVIAMSGGVDSSVAAWMLQDEGLDLVGLFMRNGVKIEEADAGKKSCCSLSDARDARMVAGKLSIPFQAVDLKAEFGLVISYFIDEYKNGRTPNPCAGCNRDLKFDRLMRFADELGAEGVATGHYARIERDEHDRVAVRRGVDETKDQSYQLFCVAEENLRRTRLPLGALRKSEVRELAERVGIRTAKKPDSQEICFVPGNDYRRLLREHNVEFHAGDIVDTAGKRLGAHTGTENYTIGQRRGLGVAGGVPLYVVDVLPDDGLVVLGRREECSSTALEYPSPNWIGVDYGKGESFEALCQFRYHCTPAKVRVEVSEDRVRVEFAEPQFAVATGQGAALYLGDRLIGGGWIDSADSASGSESISTPMPANGAQSEHVGD